MAGGKPGAVGHNRVRHAGGAVVELGPCDRVEMNAGDTFIIETPGGGGYGKPESAADERR
jgi:5-oxoprolinase (ATP-hydrolysing)